MIFATSIRAPHKKLYPEIEVPPFYECKFLFIHEKKTKQKRDIHIYLYIFAELRCNKTIKRRVDILYVCTAVPSVFSHVVPQ